MTPPPRFLVRFSCSLQPPAPHLAPSHTPTNFHIPMGHRLKGLVRQVPPKRRETKWRHTPKHTLGTSQTIGTQTFEAEVWILISGSMYTGSLWLRSTSYAEEERRVLRS